MNAMKTIVALTLFIISGFSFWKAYDSFFNVSSCADCSPLAKETVRLLREQPERWSEDSHCLALDMMPDKTDYCWYSTISWWTASGAPYLSPFNKKFSADYWRSNSMFGSREQRFVWRAYLDWHATHQYEPTL